MWDEEILTGPGEIKSTKGKKIGEEYVVKTPEEQEETLGKRHAHKSNGIEDLKTHKYKGSKL